MTPAAAPRPASAAPLRPITRAISTWFARSARPLPWRTSPRDPWASLVAEVMAQQTQISRVAERFPTFMARFPTPAAMATANLDAVLAMWSGLGYYRRARNLHAAAVEIVRSFQGLVPLDVPSLRTLPGIGRYTAGAIASIAGGQREPIVDGNVRRVLLRLHGHTPAPSAPPPADHWAWARALELVRTPAADPASLNEGLMELGATICLPAPARPRCDDCPLARWCIARRDGTQAIIPAVTTRAQRSTVHLAVVVVTNARGQLLVEPRPATGLWAGLWQPPTLEWPGPPPEAPAAELARRLRVQPTRRISPTTAASTFVFNTTHRAIHFDVWLGNATAASASASGPRRWVSRSALGKRGPGGLGISSAHRKAIAAALDVS